MKLNLLSGYSAKAGGSTGGGGAGGVVGLILMIVMAVVGVAGAFFLKVWSQGQLDDAVAEAQQYQPNHADALAYSAHANVVIAKATGVDRNIRMSQAMTSHCEAYPELFDMVLSHVPGYYRIASISAAPIGNTGATVTLTGTLSTTEEYADAMLAFYRIPGIQNVNRSGFIDDTKFVPGLIESDQIGTPIRPGEANYPSDPLDRMDDLIARAGSEASGYLNQGGFGTETEFKGAMPGDSLVTFSLSIAGYDLSAPDPRATLSSGGGGNNSGPGGFPGGPAGR